MNLQPYGITVKPHYMTDERIKQIVSEMGFTFIDDANDLAMDENDYTLSVRLHAHFTTIYDLTFGGARFTIDINWGVKSVYIHKPTVEKMKGLTIFYAKLAKAINKVIKNK